MTGPFVLMFGIIALIAIMVAVIAVIPRIPKNLGDELYPIPFPTDIWGPHFWFVLHTVAMSYPDVPSSTDKQNVANFVKAFATILPCPTCRAHFEKITTENPVNSALGSQAELMYWVWFIHNRVNVENGKPTLSKREATLKFIELQQSYGFYNRSTVIGASIIAVIAGICSYICAYF